LKKNSTIRPAGHVSVPVAVIGSLSLALAAGFELLGVLDRLNSLVLKMVNPGRDLVFTKALPEWSGWFVAVLCGFALPFALLSVVGVWRRWVLWVSVLFLIASWAPVLALAACAPRIGIPLVVASWAGICAMVYANRHQMPCDRQAGRLKP